MSDFALDAYGHLSYVIGFNDEDDEEPEAPLVTLARAPDMTDEEIEALVVEEPRTCGDWIACADAARDGDRVGYHVVVNSDSGGFIETVEEGIYTVEEARKHLPGLLETWDDVASEHLVTGGVWYTEQETQENLRAIKRWKEYVEELCA